MKPESSSRSLRWTRVVARNLRAFVLFGVAQCNAPAEPASPVLRETSPVAPVQAAPRGDADARESNADPSAAPLQPASTLEPAAVGSADRPDDVAQPAAEVPIQVDILDKRERPVTYVLRGARGPRRMVFLHGLCGYALAYLQSFQTTAAAYGSIVAPQGNKLCGSGPHSTWSVDIAVIDERIRRAYESLGVPELRDIAVIGYSMGATLAERLARRWPDRYTRLILIAAPDVPNASGLSGVRSAVMMAGDHDRQDLMRRGVTVMRSAGIASTFMALPGARHGEMGNAPERVMDEALRWLFDEG